MAYDFVPSLAVETFRQCSKKSAKGTLVSPFSGLSGFFHSCQVSTDSDKNRNATSQMIFEVE
jgi:hypothetical protein